jgi:hypothetical protein
MPEADSLAAPAGWWPQVRAGLIAGHILAITLMALPAPGEGMVREAWQDPTVQGEFAAWTTRCNRLGIQITQQEFEDRLWAVACAYMDIRDRILAPFGPYYEYCGTVQSWRMFAGPHFYPSRLAIDVRQNDEWRTVFLQRDPHLTWLSSRLDHYRFRPALYRFGWYQYVKGYDDFHHFAEWVARHAAQDYPQADEVRIRLLKLRTRSPEEVREGRSVDEKAGPEELISLGMWR